MLAIHSVKLIMISFVLLQLSACGFYLKGHSPQGKAIVSEITELTLGGSLRYNEVANSVKQQAEQANISVVDNTELVINIINIKEENTRMGGTQGADIEQYRLRLTASWELLIAGQLLLPKDLVAQQVYDYLPANQLGNDQERQLIRSELEQQLASNILRQAITIAKNPPNCDCDETEAGTTPTEP